MRWLRPEYQNKGAGKGTQTSMAQVDTVHAVDSATASTPSTRTWPSELPAQAAALSEVLAYMNTPADVAAIAAHFEGKRTKKRLDEMTKLLETLAAVGRAVEVKEGVWARA